MTKPGKETSFTRRLLRQTGKIILILSTLFVVVVVYAQLKTRWAKYQVEEFCETVIIGQPITVLENKAEKLHLNYRSMQPVGNNDGAFFVWEGFIFDRWFCDVTYNNGRATGKKGFFLD